MPGDVNDETGRIRGPYGAGTCRTGYVVKEDADRGAVTGKTAQGEVGAKEEALVAERKRKTESLVKAKITIRVKTQQRLAASELSGRN